ncbi:MAG: DUF4013 domain-containing protein [Chloroflexi bacterium]|nr:DUF4013 domain-containing protein [Chloroflexota bacterium]
MTTVLKPGLRIIFCSAGAPQADFWQVLRDNDLIPAAFGQEQAADLPEHGIGLLDLTPFIIKANSPLDPDRFDRAAFKRQLARTPAALIAFNGREIARKALGREDADFGRQTARLLDAIVYVLPGPDERRHQDEVYWRDVAALTKRTAPPDLPDDFDAELVVLDLDGDQADADEEQEPAEPGTSGSWLHWDLFTYPLEDDRLAIKALIGVGLSLISPLTLGVATLALWGYGLSIMRRTIKTGAPALPEWHTDIGGLLGDGLRVLLVRAIYFAPLALIYLLIALAWLIFFPGFYALGASGAGDLFPLAGVFSYAILAGLLGALILPLSAIASFFSQIALVRFVTTGKLGSAFNMREVWGIMRFGFKYWIVAFLVWAAAYLALGVLISIASATVVLTVGIPIINSAVSFYRIIIGNTLYGEAYNQIKTAIATAGSAAPDFSMVS